VGVGSEADFLAVADTIIRGSIVKVNLLDVENGASAGVDLVGGGHGVSFVVGGDTVRHVKHKVRVSEGVLQHNRVTKVKRSIFSVSVRHLNEGTKLKLSGFQ